jgi:chromosome partitioning protein
MDAEGGAMTPKITAIGNRKGGAGKTSVTLGLATGLTLLGKRVCVVDMDPQANITDTLGGVGDFNIFDVLYAGATGTLGQAAVASRWSNIDIVPGSEDLVRIDTENLVGAELRLRAAVSDSPELLAYDHILIDLPPAVGRLTLNGLIAADGIVVVTEPSSYSVSGVTAFLETVQKVQSAAYLNPALKFEGIIVNKVSSPVTAEHRFQIEQLVGAFGDDVHEPFLPARTAMQDSQSGGIPLPRIPSRGAAILTERFVEHARRIDGGN